MFFRRIFVILLVLFFIVIFPFSIPLHVSISTQRFYRTELIGPYGGPVYQVAIDPENIHHLFAANGALYQSFDQGSTWTYIPVPGNSIKKIAFDPFNSNILYISSDYTGIFMSTDTGKTWVFKSVPNESNLIQQLEVNKQDSHLYMGTDKGLFRSPDQGDSWEDLTPSFGDQRFVSDFAFNPMNPSIVYLSIAGKKIFVSMDLGTTWQNRSKGIVDLFIEDITVDPNSDNVIYATCINGIYKTIDQGFTWTLFPLNPTHLPPAFSTLVNPTNSNIVYTTTNDGVYTSYNAGESWSKTNQRMEKIDTHSLCFNSANSMLYASTFYGFFRTHDPRQGWNMYNQGISSQKISKVFEDPFDKNFLYAFISGYYLCRYDQAAKRWDFFPTTYSIADVVPDPLYKNVIWAVDSTRGCVVRSSDSGRTWTETSQGPIALRSLCCIQVDPKNSQILFVGTSTGRMSGGDGLYKSTDAGKHWTHVDNELKGMGTSSILICKNDTRKMTVMAGDGMGRYDAYCSIDGGNTWELVKKSGETPIVKMLLSNTPDEIFCVTYNDGIYRSTDWGKNFTKIDSYERNIFDMVIHPVSGAYYVITEHDGIIKSDDGGENWDQIYTDILPQSIFCSIAESNHENSLLCGTDKGVIRFTNEDLQISVSGSSGGSLSPYGSLKVLPESLLEVNIFPDDGYVIEKILLDLKITSFESINGCIIKIDTTTTDHTLFVSFIKADPTASKYVCLQVGQGDILLNGFHFPIDSNPGVVPIVLNSRTLLPIRALVEVLGGKVEWDPHTKTVAIFYQGRKVSLIIGNNTATIDGQSVLIDPSNPTVYPIVLANRTLLPLRFIAEAIGFSVYWDQLHQTITLVGK